jgi:DNA helicase-2/ATP-dependent DNA helicase PcrA
LQNDNSQLLPIGARIEHALLGQGTILDLDKDHNAYVIRFDKLSTPRTIATRVPLKRL